MPHSISFAKVLARHGKTNYRIVLSPCATPAQRHGAEELKAVLQAISGAEFPIVFDSLPPVETEIVIGCNRHCPFPIPSDLGEEGFIIRTVGDTLVIAGGNGRGTAYGIYTFLEKWLGCRWFTPDCTHIPRREVLTIPAIDCQEQPVLEYREPFYPGLTGGDWALHNKVNGCHCHLEEIHGGKVSYAQWLVHTFHQLVPPEEYFDSHPEYFSLVHTPEHPEGIRLKERSQLCLTHPEVLKLVIQRVKETLREHPEANIISVSQNDWGNPCSCPACAAVDREEGSRAGSLLRFVNQVAQAIEEEFPQVAVDTLAYFYTRSAPRITRPRKNVIVRLCSIECGFNHPLSEDQPEAYQFFPDTQDGYEKKSFVQDLTDWSRICNRLYIWDYVTNFTHYLLPFPNFHVLGENIRFFISRGVKGIFEEGNASQSRTGELNQLRQYLLAKLLWDPSYDLEQGASEFLAGFYGMAAPAMGEYLRLVQEKAPGDSRPMGIYCSPRDGFLPDRFVERAEEIFARAMAMAENEKILQRVREAYLSVRYLKLALTQPPEDPEGAARFTAQVDAFFADLEAAGIEQIQEGQSLDKTRAAMLRGEL